MNTADPIATGPDIWQPKGNPSIIPVAVSLAAFMEVLDTSIAHAALPHIAGNLGASNDESTWVADQLSCLERDRRPNPLDSENNVKT